MDIDTASPTANTCRSCQLRTGPRSTREPEGPVSVWPLAFFILLGFAMLPMACQGPRVGDLQAAGPNTPLRADYSLTNWMGSLDSNSELSRFSIPGSHDAGARYEPLPGTAICQTLTIDEQLTAGVRFLDIRCRHLHDAFAIYHGVANQNLDFSAVVNSCEQFLVSHPTECIIMSVKEESDAAGNTRNFEQTFDTYTAKNPSLWYLGGNIPPLGSIRGKIVLMRRFSANAAPKGIDAANWADNRTFSINNGTNRLRIQDNYVVANNEEKWTAVASMLSEAQSADGNVWYVNFTSGYRPLALSIPSIPSVSNAINANVATYFAAHTAGRFGIIVSDFSNSNMSSLIIRTNFPPAK